MNLIIDIGNSTAKVAFFSEGDLVDCVRMETAGLARFVEADERVGQCECCIVSSTIIVDAPLRAAIETGRRVLWLSGETPLPFVNDYRSPQTLGSDRVAAVAGALKQWPGEDVLVVDAGSCVTYDVLTAGGHYAGGNIAPGLQMRLSAMHDYTARLPRVAAEGELPQLGTDTLTAMRAGALRGMQFETEGYIHYLNNRCGRVKVVLTGGDSDQLKNLLAETVAHDAYLVLRGLDFILQYNEEKF